MRRGRRRAAACARRERVSRAALPDPDREVAPRAHLRELDVGPIRERRVALDEWTEPWDIDRRDVVDENDTVRIAERDDRDPYTSASDLELVDVGEGGAAHAGGHPCHPIAVHLEPDRHDPARGADPEPFAIGDAMLAEVFGEDANAVAALLRRRPIRVEDP